MHWWALVGVVLAITAFSADLGMLDFANKPVIPALPQGSPSFHTLFLFLIVFGILGRVLRMEKRKEKETLRARVKELQERVDQLEKKK